MSEAAPHRLRVEHLATALGIDAATPRFSWWLPQDSERQLAYRLQADNGWDTGRVDSAQSVLVDYGGPPLGSGELISWRVMVWTDRGESAWSAPGRFELGLLSDGDWSALWIEPVEHDVGPPGERVAMMLRGEFRLDRSVQSARLYASAHGIYELFANGTRVGDLELTPGFTEYRKLLQVHAFDVADTLISGDNAIGVLLSDGWFRGQVGLTRAHDQWGSRWRSSASCRSGTTTGRVRCSAQGRGGVRTRPTSTALI